MRSIVTLCVLMVFPLGCSQKIKAPPRKVVRVTVHGLRDDATGKMLTFNAYARMWADNAWKLAGENRIDGIARPDGFLFHVHGGSAIIVEEEMPAGQQPAACTEPPGPKWVGVVTEVMTDERFCYIRSQGVDGCLAQVHFRKATKAIPKGTIIKLSATAKGFMS